MADRSVSVKLMANVQGFVSGMKTAQQSAQDFATKGLDRIGKHEQSIQALTTGVGALGLALVGFATLAVSRFADFDQAMSNVQASTMESAENMELLREAALDAGARTAYSATEAAAAIEELAKAGVSTTDILNGGLDGALDLAAAGGIAVADAAEIAASAMTQFGLEGAEVTHIADLLAAGAGKAQGGVGDLGAALSQSGLVASQMGLSIEETVGSLTAFASAGLVGSDAGTSFRAMLLRLANPTGKSAQLMEELGISVYNAQGEFIGMEGLAGQLSDRLGGLDQQTRNAALATIFGQDAIRTSAILYEQGAEGVAEWTAAVNDQGYAAEVAAMRMDNLKGDLEQLGGAFETWLIRLGEGGDGPLRGLVQGITGVVEKLGEMPPAAQQATLGIVGGGGLVALGVAGLGKLLIGANDVRNAIKDLGIDVKGTTGKFVSFAAKAAVAVAALALLGEAGKKAEEAIYGTAAGTNELLLALRDGNYDVPFEHLTGGYDSLHESLDALAGSGVMNSVDRGMSAINQALGGHLPDDIQSAREAFAGMGEALAGMPTEEAAAQFAALAAEAEQYGFTQEQLLELMPAYADKLIGIQGGLEGAEGATDGFTDATDGSSAALAVNTEELQDNTEAAMENAGQVLSLRDAQRNFEQSVDAASDSLEENGKTLDVTTEKGRRNQAALDDIAQSGWDLIDSMRANGRSQEDLQDTMQTTRSRFVAAAESMGMSSSEARELADELGLIPRNVDVDVDANTADARAGIANVLADLRYLDGRTATVTTIQRTIEESVAYRGNPRAPRARASGGPVSARQGYWVGENGPEWFTPSTTGMISNHAASRSMGDGYGPMAGGGSPIVNVTTPGGSGETTYIQVDARNREAQAIAAAIKTRQRDARAVYAAAMGGV